MSPFSVVLALGLLLSATMVSAQCPLNSTFIASTISLNGLSLTFAAPTTIGQYANGDYWILGPVNLTATSPPFDGRHHGFEINPSSIEYTGFDARLETFRSSYVPNLPVMVEPGSSIVKTESMAPLDVEDCLPCLNKAVVFTVVGEIPPENGQYLLRPNYFGKIKYSYDVRNIDWSVLPGINPKPPISTAPSLRRQMNAFAPHRLKLDHKYEWVGRYYHPEQNMDDYGSDIALVNNEAILRFMYADTLTEPDGKCAVYRFLEVGIDHLAAMRQGGLTFPENGGHNVGRKLPIVMAAVMLRDTEAINFIKNLTGYEKNAFHEDGAVTPNALYGSDRGEWMYWLNKKDDSGSRTVADPYGYIDAGFYPGDGYDYCCNIMNWKAEALALNLSPKLREVWNYEPFMDYVARWVSHGAWTQPDPCAPVVGTCDSGPEKGKNCTSASLACFQGGGRCVAPKNDPNYGVLYGPDGKGGCILDTNPEDGIGRNPQMHGWGKDEGYYSSRFANDLFAYFFNESYTVNMSSVLGPAPPPPPPFIPSPYVPPPRAPQVPPPSFVPTSETAPEQSSNATANALSLKHFVVILFVVCILFM